MKTKRVGIVTFYLNHNYGTTLQCYALRKAVQKISDYDVIVIPHTFVNKIVNGFGEEYLRIQYDERIKKFDSFLKEEIGCNLEHIEHLTDKNVPKCDYYIAGSDVIWNTAATNSDENFFLDFTAKMDVVNIAYAPSLGTNDVSILNEKLFSKHIDRFDFLSVREKESIDFIKKYTSKDVISVLDPTLLLDREDYLKLIEGEESKTDRKFILLYLVYDNSENIPKILDYANRISLEKGYQIVHFIYNIPNYIFEDRGKSFAFSGPKEFLWYINNAEIVLTNSFHGIAFSIIFQKPFYVITRENARGKIYNILNELGLSERLFGNEIDIDTMLFSLDYENVNTKLNCLKSSSYNFLKKALNLNEKEKENYEL